MKLGWKEVEKQGRIREAGSSVKNKTGSWRSQRPVRDEEKCTNCLQCWISCPDLAVKVKDGIVVGFDLDYCKGCGICADRCPLKAIEMKAEG